MTPDEAYNLGATSLATEPAPPPCPHCGALTKGIASDKLSYWTPGAIPSWVCHVCQLPIIPVRPPDDADLWVKPWHFEC